MEGCEFIAKCTEIAEIREHKLSKQVNEDLVDKYYEVCTNGSALKQRALICSKREEYLIPIKFKNEQISVGDLPEEFEFVDEKANLHVKEDAYYFIKKESHIFLGTLRFKKSELKKVIEDRGWEGKIIVETANLPYADLLYKTK